MMRWLCLILMLSGCIGGFSRQGFRVEIEHYKDGVIDKVIKIRAANTTFAGPTNAKSVADKVIVFDVTDLPVVVTADLGEQTEIHGGEITPDQIKAGINALGFAPGLIR